MVLYKDSYWLRGKRQAQDGILLLSLQLSLWIFSPYIYLDLMCSGQRSWHLSCNNYAFKSANYLLALIFTMMQMFCGGSCSYWFEDVSSPVTKIQIGLYYYNLLFCSRVFVVLLIILTSFCNKNLCKIK